MWKIETICKCSQHVNEHELYREQMALCVFCLFSIYTDTFSEFGCIFDCFQYIFYSVFWTIDDINENRAGCPCYSID